MHTCNRVSPLYAFQLQLIKSDQEWLESVMQALQIQ
jgi:hypothetical protein